MSNYSVSFYAFQAALASIYLHGLTSMNFMLLGTGSSSAVRVRLLYEFRVNLPRFKTDPVTQEGLGLG